MKTRSVALLAELGQELADMRLLVVAYERQHLRDRARIGSLETELSVSIYDKLRWQAQAKRGVKNVVVDSATQRVICAS